MKAVKVVPCESTGSPWVLFPANAGKHGLPSAIYIVDETSTFRGGAPEGTHDGLRDGEAKAYCTGRTRAYYLAHEWVEAGNPLPGKPASEYTLNDRLLESIFGDLHSAVQKQAAEFAAKAVVEAERVAAQEKKRLAEVERKEKERLRVEQERLVPMHLVNAALVELHNDGLDVAHVLPLRWNSYQGCAEAHNPHDKAASAATMECYRRIRAEGATDPSRVADILAEILGLLEEN